jgi:hypothetical protein
MMQQRVESLHALVSVVVISYVVLIQKHLAAVTIFDPYLDQAFALLTSIGFYRILILAGFFITNRSNTMLRLLWGKEYINGIWTYAYEIGGQRRYGIWRIYQTIEGVSITGYGLDAELKIRSTFRSISPLFSNQGLHEIIFLRGIVSDPDRQHVAKTTIFLDNFRRGRFTSAPRALRAQTVILGGPETGTSHIDVCATKQEGVASEHQALAALAARAERDGDSGCGGDR